MTIFSRILTLLFLLAGLVSVQAKPERITVFATGQDRDLEDLCVAGLSSDKGVELLERRHLELLLGEKAIDAAFAAPTTRARIGKLAGVDLIVALRRDGQSVIVEVIDCKNGRILSEGDTTSKELSQFTSGLLKQAEGKQRDSRETVKVAVEDFTGQDGINYKLPAEIREGLATAGFEVLDRSVIEHVAAEHELGKAGLSCETKGSLAGADYLVRAQIIGNNSHLQLLDARKGRLVASEDIPIQQALKETLRLLNERSKNLKPSPVSVLEPRVQIEALVPLYQGIKYFRDGNHQAALLAFWSAERWDDKFVEAIDWEARCYEAMNLPIFADSVRRYAHECLVGHGVSVPSRNIPSDGITFLGIQGEGDQRLLEVKAVDELVRIAPGKIVLPDELASYRNEYDSIVGGSDKAWLTAPGFLTRWSLMASPKTDDQGKFEWTLFDTLSGSIKATAVSSLAMKKESQASLQKLISATERKTQERELPLKNKVSSKELSAPSHPTPKDEVSDLNLLHLLSTKSLNISKITKADWKNYFHHSNDDKKGFLNYALKETLRTSLPDSDPFRAWLELDKIASFMKYDPSGLLHSGEKQDPIEALKQFVGSHPDDAPGAFARYMLLIESMDAMEPKERVKACAQTVEALRQANVQGAFEESKLLLDCSLHLETLARIVADDSQDIHNLPGKPFPRAVRPNVTQGDGKIALHWMDDWLCDEWSKIPVTKDHWKQEAVAAIHILGRGSHSMRVSPTWLDQSPDSFVLLSFCVNAMHEVEWAYGLPSEGPIDAKADRSTYRRMIDYCSRNLPLWIARASDGHELMYIAHNADLFVKRLSYYAYSSSISDEEFFNIQKSIYHDIVESAQRIGENPIQYTDDYWPGMPRRVSPEIYDAWSNSQAFNRPFEYFSQEEILSASESFADSPTQYPRWWTFMSDRHGLNPMKYSEFALRHLGKMNELYHPDDLTLAPMLAEREAAFLFNYGSILFYGRSYQEAEPWFRLVASIPDSILLKSREAREIRENAKLYLAHCLEKEGRLSEALNLSLECAACATAESPPMRYILHIWPAGSGLRFEYDGFLNTVGMRFVRDIRLLESSKDLPERMRVFQIPVAGKNGDKATFFLRIPHEVSSLANGKMPLLVLNPSLNHGGSEYILDSNAWARFADEYGICLLIPEFDFGNERSGVGEYEIAESWSGKTLLKAVDWVGEHYPVKTDHFMIHGYGGGGIFVSRFVRLYPERCLAASLNSVGSLGAILDGCPALKPFSELLSLPMIITCGDRDDARFGIYNRRMITERYAAEAREAGVHVEWKVLPDTGHTPTQEMETIIQEFFVRKANLTKRRP